ncbi:FecCD family ABC transporter permease [Paenarthrobacter sp. NPDC018779]|uniref:FecCD family ABC transporter permease n=1 Tax=Paenarthrobacter sp. NPDC018779 TaxID=3364375 RepID=UPI0037CA8127
MSAIDFGRRTLTVRPLGGRVSARLDVRSMIVTAVLTGAALALAVVALGLGEFSIPVPDVVSALFGRSTGAIHMVVVEWRLPRVLLALLLGAAMGVSGAIFQSLTRNALGSPDVIGFNTGAYSGALVVILLMGGGYYAVSAGALVGGLVTAVLVYLFAYKKGIQGFRLIIAGIAVSAMLASVNTYMILKASLEQAMSAAVWGAGSLNKVSWEQVLPVLLIFAGLLAVLAFYGRRLGLLEMGDDAARALGVRLEGSRVVLAAVGVALTAMVTAAAGPIAFVSLAAPQLARRLTRSASVGLVPSAAMGALLLVASDIVAQNLFAPIQLPVGVVTVSIGGCYLVWLLAREVRRQ